MPKWSDYKKESQERGSLAFELYVVESTPVLPPDQMRQILPDHLAYQSNLEKEGKLFLAGPRSDESGEEMTGAGLIIYNAASMEEAKELADGDPMHAKGGRTYVLKRWLVNEGALSLQVGLSTKNVKLD